MRNSSKKRVLMLVENLSFPEDPRVRQEAFALTGSGYQVSVICPQTRKQSRYEVIQDIHVYRYPAPREGSGFIGYLWEYSCSLASTFLLSLLVWVRHGFDVIHSANPPDTAILIAVFYKLFGKKFIFDHHDLAPEMYNVRFYGKGNKFVHRMLIWLEVLSCRLANQVIATNESYKAIEVQRSGIPKERVTIVRNGPDLDRLTLVEPDPELRRKGRLILGYVGNIAIQDGLDYLLRALHLLKSELGREDFYCIIIGKGIAINGLKELAAQLGLKEHICFTGFIPESDMIRYLSTADICVDPDPSNPFNDRCTMIKMMEYMALSKPIVAFDLPEHRVTAGEAALYARPNDELDFARQIALLMDDHEQCQKMGRKGRERIEKELAWPNQIKRLVEAYEMLNH